MPYCTLDQLTDRYGEPLLVQLSDRGPVPAVVPDADLFARAIADADALIDGYLKARYALPLSPVPALVTDLSQRIAIYNAHASSVGDKIKADHEMALKQLKDIASGLSRLDAAGVEPAASDAAEVLMSEPERPLSATSMKGWI
jgi:phage gp36-like protein